MANVILLCLGSLLVSGFSHVKAGPASTEHESCRVWDDIAKQLTSSTETQHKCSSNGTDPCTRIDCSGAFEYNDRNTGRFFNVGKNSIEVDYCFGIILNHCDKNISLDFYLQVPAKNVDKTSRVFHNTLLSIPGLSYSISSGTSAQGYLYFQMERRGDYVTFSVTVKVRVSFAGFNTWPTNLQRRLISNETVPVPACEGGSANATSPIPTIGECRPQHWKDGRPATGGQVVFNSSGLLHSDDLDKPCKDTHYCFKDPWLSCNHSTSLCDCSPDFEKVFDNKTKTNMCRPLIRHLKSCRSDNDCNLQTSERCLNGHCHCQQGDVFNSETQTCESAKTGLLHSDDLDKPCKDTHYCFKDPWLACNRSTNLCDCSPDFEKVFDSKTKTNMCQPLIHHLKSCMSDDDCSLQMSERCLNGRCHCQQGDVFNNKTQTCEPAKPGWFSTYRSWSTIAPHIATALSNGATEKTGQNKAAILASAIVGGLVVLAGILLAAYFAIRRLRRPYQHRELLLEGEDSDGIM